MKLPKHKFFFAIFTSIFSLIVLITSQFFNVAYAATIPTIFDDTLASNWVNWSWNSNINFQSTTRNSGNYSISYTANQGWAGLYLHTDVALNTSSYSSLQFSLKATQNNQTYGLYLTNSNNNTIKSVNISDFGGTTSTSWKTYNIPLSSLNAVNTNIKGIIFQEFTGNAQPAIYLDDIKFVSSTNIPTPTPTPTVQPTQTISPIPTLVPTNTPVPSITSTTGLPSLPNKWPYKNLQIGSSDSPGGAASLKSSTNVNIRYQYLTGGVNTGNSWATWNTNGDFAKYYIEDSINNGMMPVFTYYQIRPSTPGNGMGESDGDYTNAQNTSTMKSYYNDLKLFYQKAGIYSGKPIVLHVEPDFWGFMQQKAGDNGNNIPTSVSSSGMSELSGLPNTLSGFAQAILKLRDIYAPNVIVAYHLSIWGTGNNIIYSNTTPSGTDLLANRSVAFYKSLNANFDLSFMDQTDRDAGFKQYISGDSASWYDAADYSRSAQYISTFVKDTGKRMVIWQVPLGNTKMRADNNSWNHYQDNHVEWWFDDSSRSHLQEYINAGVISILFGRGADGNTCACDAAGDGITNPNPINNNNLNSINSDDDGGYFKQKIKGYYSSGVMNL